MTRFEMTVARYRLRKLQHKHDRRLLLNLRVNRARASSEAEYRMWNRTINNLLTNRPYLGRS